MAEWISPVHNRTQQDVDYAKEQLKNKNNQSELKGCFNVTDINRIENNTRYIADRLNVLLYVNHIETKLWSMYDLPNVPEIARLIGNVAALIKAYHIPDDAPPLPSTLLGYEEANALEKNLYLIKHLVDNEENAFKHCGTFACGEEW